MKIAVLGIGHVGLATATALAKIGHDVVGYEDDEAKADAIRNGLCPFFEPDQQELLEEVLAAGRFAMAGDPSDAIEDADVAFICVGTPVGAGGNADLSAVERAAISIGKSAERDMIVAERSTVPVETAERIEKILTEMSSHNLQVVSNPEFLREGRAVHDSLHPERILVGAGYDAAHKVMRQLYGPLLDAGVRYVATDIRTAELAKHACNSFLALKIAFANALARICESSSADVVAIADVMGMDPRIGRDFLDAGLGYGGFCLPKDVAAFQAQAARLGYDFTLLDEVVRINEQALEAAFEKVRAVLGDLRGKKVFLLGLAFKPGTDDVREAPSLRLAGKLLGAGAVVRGHDPHANATAQSELSSLEVFDDPYEAANGADCIVVCTEWPEFGELDLARLRKMLNRPVVVDARNLFDPRVMEKEGFTYLPTGRPPVNL